MTVTIGTATSASGWSAATGAWAARGAGPPLSPSGRLGLSNHSHSGGWRNAGSSRSYSLQLRKPASLTADVPGVKTEPPSAQLGGGTVKLSVCSPRE